MKLTKAEVTKYKSIENSSVVDIDDNVTVMVGVNEAGKSAFLEALWKSESVLSGAKFNDVFDYPRKDWLSYKRRTDKDEASVVAKLTYELTNEEMAAIEGDVGEGVMTSNVVVEIHKIDNSSNIVMPVEETAYLKRLVDGVELPEELKSKMKAATSIKELIDILDGEDLAEKGTEFKKELEAKFKPSNSSWENTRLRNYVWKKYVNGKEPKFLYFSDYNILPGKINIPHLRQAKENDTTDPALRTALGLLEMANISMEDLENPDSYEEIKAELEAVSLDISNKVFNYWQQNKQLLVEFDVKSDPNEEVPFNNGANLYIRVKNLDHGVSVPFDQRSKGFVWFFSFIVWFNSVKNRIGTSSDLILLLDEPGLSLHGLAQADFLHYIDDLSKEYQILYTTHSPFMIDSEKLHQVRTVEDVKGGGTVVAGSLESKDRRTLFPLQAGLGYSLAQNLFIAKKNALVEGPADLLYWKYFSAILEKQGRTYLDEGIVIVPTGGLDKIATFVSLLSGNELDMAIVHDYEGKSDQRLDSLIRNKIIKDKQVTNYAHFRDSKAMPASDVEDLIETKLYVKLFNDTYVEQLAGKVLKVSDLPSGDRIVIRINEYLAKEGIILRKSGGFNHYLVANHLLANPVSEKSVPAVTLDRFERMFIEVNKLLS